MTERACGLAGFRPGAAVHSSDLAAQLAIVAAGVGVALVPELAARPTPEGVRMAAPASPVTRDIHAARRTATDGDPGLDRRTALLADAARHRLRGIPEPTGGTG